MNDEQQAAFLELSYAVKRRRSNNAAAAMMTDREREYTGMNAAAQSDYARYIEAKKRCEDLGVDLSGYDIP